MPTRATATVKDRQAGSAAASAPARGGLVLTARRPRRPGAPALTNPADLTLALGFGALGYLLAFGSGQLFREGIFRFMTSYSLPWYAIVGAQKGVDVGLPVWGCLLLGVVGPTAGRYYIDLTSDVPAKQFIRGEWFVGTAVLTAAVWILVYWTGAGTWAAAGVAFAVGFSFRLVALFRGWEEPLAREPAGVYLHDEGRPLLGRKPRGKSMRELRDLGLLVEGGSGDRESSDAHDGETASARQPIGGSR